MKKGDYSITCSCGLFLLAVGFFLSLLFQNVDVWSETFREEVDSKSLLMLFASLWHCLCSGKSYVFIAEVEVIRHKQGEEGKLRLLLPLATCPSCHGLSLLSNKPLHSHPLWWNEEKNIHPKALGQRQRPGRAHSPVPVMSERQARVRGRKSI